VTTGGGVADAATRDFGAGIEYPTISWSLDPPEREVVRIVAREQPPWLPGALAKIDELMSLSVGWDEAVAPTVRSGDALDALHFLRDVMADDTELPWFSPLVTGGVQMTWGRPDLEVEAIFDSTRDDRIVLVTDHGEEWEAPPYEAVPLFRTFVDRLRAV
jgi:hypothetical protein